MLLKVSVLAQDTVYDRASPAELEVDRCGRRTEVFRRPRPLGVFRKKLVGEDGYCLMEPRCDVSWRFWAEARQWRILLCVELEE